MSRRKKPTTVALPLLQPVKSPSSGGCGTVRPSRRGRWRALSLFLVHVAVAIHIAHWWKTGKTITPVEPSEAMQTLGSEALVNAGFVLFALTILSTFVFGRFFCGWGCHVIAYQDLCTWMLKKIGIRPQPFRSRLLIFVPLGAALFMFVMPTLVRVVMGTPRAPYTAHFATYDFWDRFPGWVVGSLTLFVCGFVIVYLLGNKGFCTYACPYGGFFGVADQFAPGKIRVTDACEQCGHCTATCSSNVRVHEEVNLYGMVVDPGCMKCLDCINVCPKDALYFGFGVPSVTGRKRAPAPARRFDYTWPEELALAALFGVAIAILRKLYDGVPFLLALALASITAYTLLCAARLVYKPSVRFARLQLRLQGKLTRAGTVFTAVVGLWVVFLGHSAVVQYLTVRGRAAIRAAHTAAGAPPVAGRVSARAHLDRGIALLARADDIGLVPVVNLLFDLGVAYGGRGDTTEARVCFERAVDFAPRFAAGHYELAKLAREAGDPEAAVTRLRAALHVAPEFPNAHSDLATLLIGLDRSDEAVSELQALIDQRPDVVAFHLAFGLTLAHAGALDRAVTHMRATAARWPDHPDAHFNLGSTLATQGDLAGALTALQEAVRLNPRSAITHTTLAQVALRAGQTELADRHVTAALDIDPFDAATVQAWVAAVHRRAALPQEIESAERAAALNRAARFRLIYLYAAAGRTEDARRMAAEFAGMPGGG